MLYQDPLHNAVNTSRREPAKPSFRKRKKWRNEKRERPRFTRVPNCEGRFDKSKVDYCFERQFVIEERVHVICMVIWMVIWDFSS